MASKLTDERLDSLYTADDFGGSTTMRGRVIRELIDEIRTLRNQGDDSNTTLQRAREAER